MTLWQWLKLEWHWAVPALLLGAVVLGVCVRIVRNRRRVSAALDEQESTQQEIEHQVIEDEPTVAASDVQLANYDSVVAVDSRNVVGNGNNGTDEQHSTEEARNQRIRDGIEALHKAQVEQRERIEARTGSRTDRPREARGRFQKPNHISTVVSAMLPKAISDQTGNGLERETKVESTTTQSASAEDFRFITDLFDDPATEVRNLAARALYHFQSDRAASFTRALREASPERRRRIGAALATSGLANEALTNLAGENLDKAYDAFSVLFLMAKSGEVQPLIKAIEDGPNMDVRLAVVKLLALSGQADVVSAFRRMAVRSSLPPELRSAVMEAIHQIAQQ